MRGKKKRRKVILSIIIILIVLLAAMISGGVALPKHYYGDKTEILKSAAAQTEKALIVYQPSLTSASHDIAYAIAGGLNASGYEVTVSYPGEHLSTDISAYSIIVFGSPNYGGSVAVPLTEYVKQIDDFTGKKVILFSTFGLDGSIKSELDKLEALLHGIEPYATVKYRFNEDETNNAAAYQLGVDAAGT